jgi:hypothetical protein
MGKVLGIWFDTTTLRWSLPEEKRVVTDKAITETMSKVKPELSEIQSLMGRLNVISIMCPFMNIFKFNLNSLLAELLSEKHPSITTKIRNDLKIWQNFIWQPSPWIPICPEKTAPPIATLKFVSDAAGLADNSKWSGCGVIGVDVENNTILGYQMWWPKEFISSERENKGKHFGNKTTTLEMIALILPLILIPESLRNMHIRLVTDNMACVYGMNDGYTKNDEYASILIRAAHLIGAYLGSVIHVIHTPRRSTWETTTADNFTRKSTTSFLEHQILGRYSHLKIPEVLTAWLRKPSDDWELAKRLLA